MTKTQLLQEPLVARDLRLTLPLILIVVKLLFALGKSVHLRRLRGAAPIRHAGLVVDVTVLIAVVFVVIGSEVVRYLVQLLRTGRDLLAVAEVGSEEVVDVGVAC